MLEKIKNLKKDNLEEDLIFHPGVYKFQFPFLKNNLVPDENNTVEVHKCNVEIYVGEERDLNEGTLATIIVKNADGLAVENFIQDIATGIRMTFFRMIFQTRHPERLNNIRWVEYYDKNYMPAVWPDGMYTEFVLDWNDEEKKYSYNTSKNYEGR